MTDAHQKMNISRRALRRLAEQNHGVVSRATAKKALVLFDRKELGRLQKIAATALTLSDVAKQLGVPNYVIATLVDGGLLSATPEPAASTLAGEMLLDKSSFDRLLRAIQDAAAISGEIPNCADLRTAMIFQLNPWVWVEALRIICLGKVAFRVAEGTATLADRLLVDQLGLQRCIRRRKPRVVRTSPFRLWLRSRLFAINNGVLSRAASAGLIERSGSGLSLPSLAKFREHHVFPAEVRSWFPGTPHAFRNAMASRGARPVVNLSKVNVWLRSDVERCFPESPRTEYQRDWSQ